MPVLVTGYNVTEALNLNRTESKKDKKPEAEEKRTLPESNR